MTQKKELILVKYSTFYLDAAFVCFVLFSLAVHSMASRTM